MVDESNFVTLVGALIGALGGSLGGNFFTYWLSQRTEKEKLRKYITDKYLIQMQYLLGSLYFRLYNMNQQGGAEFMRLVKGNDEYYVSSSLYALGAVLAYHQLLLFEGIYSQIESLYPKMGSELLNKLDKFGNSLDKIRISIPNSNSPVQFFRYDRMLLGDLITNDENDIKRIYSYAQFRQKYENEEFTKKSIEPAKEFVNALQYLSAIPTLTQQIREILQALERQTHIITLEK